MSKWNIGVIYYSTISHYKLFEVEASSEEEAEEKAILEASFTDEGWSEEYLGGDGEYYIEDMEELHDNTDLASPTLSDTI